MKKIDPNKIGDLMRNKNLLDTRNCLSHEIWGKAGFSTYSLGDGKQNNLTNNKVVIKNVAQTQQESSSINGNGLAN